MAKASKAAPAKKAATPKKTAPAKKAAVPKKAAVSTTGYHPESHLPFVVGSDRSERVIISMDEILKELRQGGTPEIMEVLYVGAVVPEQMSQQSYAQLRETCTELKERGKKVVMFEVPETLETRHLYLLAELISYAKFADQA